MGFDLNKAAEILRAEADFEPFPFSWDGEEYELPATIDMRIPMLLQGGDLMGAFSVLLGTEQWARLSQSPSTFDEFALRALFDAYKEHRGIDLGESLASRPSLASTPRPSKQTSSGTTRSRSRTSPSVASHGVASAS